MRRFYFTDTDTLLFEFSDERAVDYVDLDEQTLLELDCNGHPVVLTIEHARERNVVPECSLEQVPLSTEAPVGG